MIRYKSARVCVILLCSYIGFANAAESGIQYPIRPISLVVPFAPGGNTDVVARVIADKLSQNLKQPIVVENKGGGGAIIGMNYVAQSKPDGYTLLFGTAAYPISGALYKTLPYDASEALTPVSLVAEVPMVLSVSPKVKAVDAQAFIEEIKRQPGKYNFGSGGSGSSPHMAVELLKYQETLDIVHIPYRGAGPALVDLMSGEVDFMIDPVSTSGPLIADGRIRPLAVSTARRSSRLPDIPTLQELGFTDYETSAWNMVYAPGNTPDAIISYLAEELQKVVQDPTVKNKLMEMGVEPIITSDSEARSFLKDETKKWSDVIKAGNIQIK